MALRSREIRQRPRFACLQLPPAQIRATNCTRGFGARRRCSVASANVGFGGSGAFSALSPTERVPPSCTLMRFERKLGLRYEETERKTKRKAYEQETNKSAVRWQRALTAHDKGYGNWGKCKNKKRACGGLSTNHKLRGVAFDGADSPRANKGIRRTGLEKRAGID